jgi:hypothetical protein
MGCCCDVWMVVVENKIQNGFPHAELSVVEYKRLFALRWMDFFSPKKNRTVGKRCSTRLLDYNDSLSNNKITDVNHSSGGRLIDLSKWCAISKAVNIVSCRNYCVSSDRMVLKVLNDLPCRLLLYNELVGKQIKNSFVNPDLSLRAIEFLFRTNLLSKIEIFCFLF